MSKNKRWLSHSVSESVSDKVTYWAVRWQLKICLLCFPSNVLFVACFRWQVYYSSNMEIYNFREYPTRILSTWKHRTWQHRSNIKQITCHISQLQRTNRFGGQRVLTWLHRIRTHRIIDALFNRGRCKNEKMTTAWNLVIFGRSFLSFLPLLE